MFSRSTVDGKKSDSADSSATHRSGARFTRGVMLAIVLCVPFWYLVVLGLRLLFKR
jgi:hypothetical protein